jgi:hypothetical protein
MSHEFPTNLLALFNPKYLDFAAYEVPGCGYRIGDLILLNSNDPEDVQVQAYLHEICHSHPNFNTYEGEKNRDDAIEAQIESLAQHLYSARPDIVIHARSVIREAKKLQSTLDARIDSLLEEQRHKVTPKKE